jgi:uncharacterized OsmC-like protein
MQDTEAQLVTGRPREPSGDQLQVHARHRKDQDQEPEGGRVVVDIGPPDARLPGARAELTPARARVLARRLLREAARAELGDGALTVSEQGTVEAEATGHSAWCATAAGRHLFTTAGGPFGLAPTGAELLAATAAVCAAARVGEYLEARGLSRRHVEVRAHYASRGLAPARVTAVRLDVRLLTPLGLTDREGVRDVLNRCTVVNSLQQPPGVVIDLRFPRRGGTTPEAQDP